MWWWDSIYGEGEGEGESESEGRVGGVPWTRSISCLRPLESEYKYLECFSWSCQELKAFTRVAYNCKQLDCGYDQCAGLL